MRIRIFCLLLLLIGCREAATPTATTVPTVVAATETPRLLPTFTPTSAPTETPLPTPTATPIVILPSLDVADQTVDDSGELTVASVVAPDGGWIVVRDGEVSLASAEIPPTDEPTEVVVTIDPLDVGDTVTIGLFADEAGEDALVDSAEINLTKAVTIPSFRVSDQNLDGDRIFVTDVVTTEDSWIVIANDRDGEAGEVVGLQWVRAGRSAAVPIEIGWRQSSPFLHALMMWDGGEIGRYDPATDNPITVNNAPVSAQFSIDIPPSVTVIDQPVLDDTILVDRVISPHDGWLTVSRTDDSGEIENVVGFTAISAGINEDVMLEFTPGTETDTMYLQIHPDDGEIGEFEYPAFDRPEIYGVDFLTFPFSTVAGNYLISADQPLAVANGRATVTVPLVVVDLPVWVAIRTELAPGALGDVIGFTYVEAGISRDIIVEVDAEAITPTLYVALHIDRDEPEVFEFPDGRDFELQRRLAPLAVPFTILE